MDSRGVDSDGTKHDRCALVSRAPSLVIGQAFLLLDGAISDVVHLAHKLLFAVDHNLFAQMASVLSPPHPK